MITIRIKILSDGFLFRPPLTIEVVRLYHKSDDDWTGFGRILVVRDFASKVEGPRNTIKIYPINSDSLLY
jgi:hypothetical protein